MHDSKRLDDQVELLFRHTPTVLFGIFVVTIALAFSFYNVVSNTVLIAWLGAVYALIIIRLILLNRFKHRKKYRLSSRDWAYIGALTSFISGCQWGAGAFIFFTPDEEILNALLTILLLGMASGSVASLSVYPLAYLGYSIPSLLSLAYVFLTTGEDIYVVMGTMSIAFLFVNLSYSRHIYRTVITSIDLRHENTDLVEKLANERDRAEKANRAKSKFLAAASHDLRQPLQAITLLSDSLHNRLKNPDEIEISEKITKSVSGLRELFDGLLDVSKLDAGTIQANYGHFDFEKLVYELIKEFKPLATEKDISLINNTQPFITRSDPLLLKRILQNLISNAIKYSHRGAQVAIVTHDNEDNHFLVSIKDNGPGIPKEEQKNIFKEFHQLGNPERDRHKGLGLGLAIVKRLTEIIGSEIIVSSIPGQGSTFSFRLPLGDASKVFDEQQSAGYITNKTADFSNVHALVIDDEKDVRDAIVNTLQGWGCKTSDMEDVIDQNLEEVTDIDFVISDFRLRDNRTGVQAIETLKEHLGRVVPGIIITGDTGPERIRQANESGNLLLHKPINPAQLRMAIDHALKIKAELK